jgi:hypothetical protein
MSFLKILQRTEVEVGDLIGLGINPMIRVDNPENERFIYKCCIPDVVDLLDSDDDENSNESKCTLPDRSNGLTSKPIHSDHSKYVSPTIASPGFSSDASTASFKESINRAIQTIDNDVSNPINDEKLKSKVEVKLERLTADTILQYKPKTEPEEKNDKEEVDLNDVKTEKGETSKYFSRTKHETKLKTREINRRMSKYVDPDTEEEDNIVAHTPKSVKKSSAKRKLTKDPIDMHHTAKKLNIAKESSPKIVRGSSPKIRNSSSSSRATHSRIAGNNSLTSTPNQAKAPLKEVTSTKQPINEQIQNTFSSKEKKVEKLAFPSTSSYNEKVSSASTSNNITNKIQSRRHTMYAQPRRQTILLDSQQSMMIDRNRKIASRLKSVDMRPTHNDPLASAKKEKLKELALRKKEEIGNNRPLGLKAPLRVR